MVADRLFGHAGRRGDGGHPGRDEAVHFTVQAHAFEHAGAVGLEAAAQVLELQLGDLADDAVGNLGGHLAQPQAVLAVLAPAGHQIQVFLEQTGHQLGDVLGVVLQVAVERDDDIAARGVDAGLHGGGLAEVAPQVDGAHVRATQSGLFIQFLLGAVAAAVVDDQQFPLEGVVAQGLVHGRDKGFDAVDLVVHRHDDGEAVRRDVGQDVARDGGEGGHGAIFQHMGGLRLRGRGARGAHAESREAKRGGRATRPGRRQ